MPVVIVGDHPLRVEPVAQPGLLQRPLGPVVPEPLLADVLLHDGKEVSALPIGSSGKGKVVDPGHVGRDLVALGLGNVEVAFDQARQAVLRAKDLVAAAKGLDLGLCGIERRRAQGHRVRIVDRPGIGAVFHDLVGIVEVDRHCAQGAADPARPGRVADRLQDAVLGRDVQVVGKHLHRPGQDGEKDEIRSPQRLCGAVVRVHVERRHRIRVTVDPFRELDVPLRGFIVDVIECDLACQVLAQCQVGHHVPGPVAAAAADVGDLDLFGHLSSLPLDCAL